MPQKNNRTTFAIVTPSYNQAQFIKQTIDSVLSQACKQIKIHYIVMDGKSTDETVNILQSYKDAFAWVSEKDNGQTDAINKGVSSFQRELSTSAAKVHLDPRVHEDTAEKNSQPKADQQSVEDVIFAYINSDDYYLPGAFERVAREFIDHPESSWLVGDAVIVDATGRQIQRPIRLYKQLFRLFPSWVWLILNPIPQPATFIRWSALERVGDFTTDLRYTMDYEYWLRMRQSVGDPHMVRQPLAAFRIHGESKGGSQFIKQFAEGYAVAKRFTHNPLLLAFHKLHNALILFVYGRIK